MTIAGSGREREREARVGGDDHREEGVHIYIRGIVLNRFLFGGKRRKLG